MKRITTLLLGVALGTCSTSQAQTFVPPAVAEIISVPNTAAAVSRIQHTSCYTTSGVSFGGVTNNLYAYSWNAPYAGGNLAGIGWVRRNSTDATIFNQGFMTVSSDIADLEVGFITYRGVTYLISTYYKFSTSHHMMDIYQWTATGLTPFNMGNILSTSAYGRISLDVHEQTHAAITWQDAGGLHVKLVYGGGAGVTINNSVLITNVPASTLIPDVAFGHATGLSAVVRVAFVDGPTGDIHVMRKDLPALLAAGPTTTFITDDVNAGIFTGINAADFILAPNNLNLDCPDHYAADNWSYVFTPTANVVLARIKTNPNPVININLNPGLTSVPNFHPTIAYDRSGKSINYGWFTNFANRGYVAVERSETGAFITPSGTYKVVSNYTGFGPGGITNTPVMAFSKQNDASSMLYAVYPILPPNNTSLIDLRTKMVSWTATTFNAVIPNGADLFAAKEEATIYPNPFSNKLMLNISSDRGEETYKVTIADISGKTVQQLYGTQASINGQLGQWAGRSANGLYLVHVGFDATGTTKTIKIVKN